MSKPMDKEVALDFFAVIFGGRHHVPELKPWGFGWCITTFRDLSTYDSSLLTCLVLLAHDRAIRVEVSSCNFRYLRIAVHQRERVAEYTYDRHPSIDQALETWRKRNPTPVETREAQPA